MKTSIIIAICLVAVIALKVIDLLTIRKRINSVGGKSNANSKNISKMDLSDPESVKEALKEFKGLAD